MLSRPSLKLIEPVPVTDKFYRELVAIEEVGHNARFVLASPHTLFESGGEQVLVVLDKIVLPLESLQPAVDLTLRFLGGQVARSAGRAMMRVIF